MLDASPSLSYADPPIRGTPRTDVGVLAEEIVASGGLIPDDVMLRVVTSKLDALAGKVRNSVLAVLPTFISSPTPIALDS